MNRDPNVPAPGLFSRLLRAIGGGYGSAPLAPCEGEPCEPRLASEDDVFWSECARCERYSGPARGFMVRTGKREFREFRADLTGDGDR